jgi:hypothetical protein
LKNAHRHITLYHPFSRYSERLLSGLDFWCYLEVYADCENVLAVLEPTGILDLVRTDFENTYG